MNVQSAMERASPMHRIARFALLVATGALAACASVGPGKVVSTHIAYNEAVQLTTTREVLVNVARGRYSDPMSFVRVEAINASFSVTAGATAGAGMWSVCFARGRGACSGTGRCGRPAAARRRTFQATGGTARTLACSSGAAELAMGRGARISMV